MLGNSLPRLAFFIPTLHCGGAERMIVNLVRGAVALEIPTDLILAKAEGSLLADVPSAARIIELNVPVVYRGVPALCRYLRSERPHGVVSRMIHCNLTLVAARTLARSKTRVVITEATTLSAAVADGFVRPRVLPVARWLYPLADQIVAVSQGAARDLEQVLRLKAERIRIIPNPVVDAQFFERAEAASPHRWLSDRRAPLLLSVGRLGSEKDHATLLRAFALLRRSKPARLIVFGEGTERVHLEQLRRELGLEADVDFPGVTANPAAAMSRAALFVLSSRFEGFPNVLAEALACGCPVVSTNCPSGPAEILADGKFGLLVPPGDPAALAASMLAALDRNWDRPTLAGRGAEFSVSRSLSQYLAALDYRLPQPALAQAA